MIKKTIKKFIFSLTVTGILFSFSYFSLLADEIHDAASEGNLQKVIELLKGNSKLLNKKENNGYTPLHYACWYGKTEVANLKNQ